MPRARTLIAATLRTLGLKLAAGSATVSRAAREHRRLYSVPVVDASGTRYFFKARLQDDPWLTRSLKHEAAVLKELDRQEGLSFVYPRLAASGQSGDFAWVLREYWDGTFSGEMNETFGMTSAFLRRLEPRRLAKAVHDVGRLPRHFRDSQRTVIHGRAWFLLDHDHYATNVFPAFFNHPLNRDRIRPSDLAILRQRYTRARVFPSATFTHGDLYPNNILLTPNGRLTLNDWDFSHLNLPTFDGSMVALHAWRNPAWARQFIRHLHPLGRYTKESWLLTHSSLALRLTGYAVVRLLHLEGRYDRPSRRDVAELRRLLAAHSHTLRTLIDHPRSLFTSLRP